MLPINLNSIF